ncbi:MAG: 2-succinyl-6-hydroxy-2,4-cyclohexadiene-1-carboxylate synthase [Dehalococcoidia bacterium]
MTRIEVAPGYGLSVECQGSGPPIVVLHGFTGSAANAPLGSRLAVAHTVIAIDAPGHGQSDRPADLDHYRMAQAVEDAVQALRNLGHARAAWLGYSMGGRWALSIAAAHPEAIERLVVIGASPGIAAAEERAARVASDETLAQRILNEGVAAFVDYWENIPLFASQKSLPEAVRARVREGRMRNDAHGLANSLRGMGAGAQEPVFKALPRMAFPALILAGEWDTKYVGIGKDLAVALPSARFASIANAGHAAHLENPEGCLALIEPFLTEPSATGAPS